LSQSQRLRIRFLLTFVAGMAAVVLASTVGSVGSSASTRYEELSLFTNVLTLVRRNYVEPVDERKLVRGAVRGMLAELDPHSSFMDSEAYTEMQVDTKGEFHGLGIEITKTRDGYIEVVSPIEGTPADRVGVKSRDQIVAICPTERPEEWDQDCGETKSMTLFEAVSLMRGKKGTKITIEVLREGYERPLSFTITRDVVKVVSVSGRMLEPGYGYVRIRSFQERTSQDLEDVLDDLHEESGGSNFDGLVIDLRDNPGGLLNQAVQVADTWLADGLVVYTKGRADDQRQEFRAAASGTEPVYPITVLVNEGSASASEIVAGALQDQRRALVVGQKTFGKGSVQTVYPLEGGNGLRLTTALYYTPGGRSIQEVGIAPDIVVANALPADGSANATMRRRMREADLDGHFKHEDADPSDIQQDLDDAGGESEDGLDPEAMGDSDEDVQLARALEVLKSWTYFERLNRNEEPALVQASSAEEESAAARP